MAAAVVIAAFCRFQWQTSWEEFAAFLLSVAGVYLAGRESILNFPVGIVSVLLYAKVFFDGKLFADSGLQIYYALLLVHGWRVWMTRKGEPSLSVKRLSQREWLWVLGAIVVGTALLTPVLVWAKGARPLIDTFLAVSSLVTQYLLNRKYIENWAFWIVIDLVYIPLYIDRKFYATAVLYAVFLILAAMGWQSWLRSEREEKAPR